VPIFTIHWLWASEDSFQMLNHLSGAVFSATFGLAVLFGGDVTSRNTPCKHFKIDTYMSDKSDC
jgi:hypothetical protein